MIENHLLKRVICKCDERRCFVYQEKDDENGAVRQEGTRRTKEEVHIYGRRNMRVTGVTEEDAEDRRRWKPLAGKAEITGRHRIDCRKNGKRSKKKEKMRN